MVYMTQRDLEARWVTPEGIPGVAFRFGDNVRVCSGKEAGKIGRVVALLAIEPVPLYVLEFMSTGESLNVLQSEIERAA